MVIEDLADHLKVVSKIDENNVERVVEITWDENGETSGSQTKFAKDLRRLLLNFAENPTQKLQDELLQIPYTLYTTDFRKRLYEAVLKIPFGQTASYKDLAEQIGSAPRAVGQAIKHNPLMFLVPCHRVIKHDGSLGGYFGDVGLELKAELLHREKEAI